MEYDLELDAYPVYLLNCHLLFDNRFQCSRLTGHRNGFDREVIYGTPAKYDDELTNLVGEEDFHEMSWAKSTTDLEEFVKILSVATVRRLHCDNMHELETERRGNSFWSHSNHLITMEQLSSDVLKQHVEDLRVS